MYVPLVWTYIPAYLSGAHTRHLCVVLRCGSVRWMRRTGQICRSWLVYRRPSDVVQPSARRVVDYATSSHPPRNSPHLTSFFSRLHIDDSWPWFGYSCLQDVFVSLWVDNLSYSHRTVHQNKVGLLLPNTFQIWRGRSLDFYLRYHWQSLVFVCGLSLVHLSVGVWSGHHCKQLCLTLAWLESLGQWYHMLCWNQQCRCHNLWWSLLHSLSLNIENNNRDIRS